MSSSRLGVKTETISSFHQHFIRTNTFMFESCFQRFWLDVRILLRPKKERREQDWPSALVERLTAIDRRLLIREQEHEIFFWNLRSWQQPL
jgi:hypothetical protein